jgi:hypothetical protein
MFHCPLLMGLIGLTIVHVDMGQVPVVDSINAPPPPYNYYDYQARQSQQQLQTPSPYLQKRNPNGNSYVNAAPSPYSTVASRTAANQCKLHINCPSKHR